jgi:hypothetical protein
VLNDYVERPLDVAKCITNLLSKLADKVVPYSFFDSFMNINTDSYPDRGRRLEVLKNILNPDKGNMPKINYHTLAWIVSFMKKVAA